MVESSSLQLISGRLERGEIDSARYLEELTQFVASAIVCSRAGVRLFVDTPGGRVLRTVAMYDATLDQMISVADIFDVEVSLYFEQLLHDGSVLISDARTDPVTAGAMRDYVREANVTSLMDMSFSVNGVLFGTFSCEQTGPPTDWTQRQLQSLRKVASRASLTLMHLVSASVDTAPGALWETSTPNRLATMPMPLDAISK